MIARVCFVALTVAAGVGGIVVASAGEETQDLFAPSRLKTASGKMLAREWGFAAEDCGECHPVQYGEWKGSLHNRAHHDSLYLAFAHRAREEGGDALYRFCSGCHAAAAVASGEIPGGPERKATFHTDDGVSCMVCHAVKRSSTVHAGGGANGSIVLESGDIMYGPLADPGDTPAHLSQYSKLHTQSEFCSNCHTLTHPVNGLVIENTFEEWKNGPYAAAGIQCQDCHMRSIEQATEVAARMQPSVGVPGRTTDAADRRPDVHAHQFVGGSVNAAVNGSSEAHAVLAEKRLRSAAEVQLKLPSRATPGAVAAVEVAVTNRAAGHAIPTSITELRQVWIDLHVTDASGREVFHSGAIDDSGRVDPKAVMYHSVLLDERGEVTYLPWRAVKMAHEKLIPPRQTVRERYEVAVPTAVKGPLTIRVALRYRSAPQDVLDALFGRGKLTIRPVDMATAEALLSVE